MSCDITKGIKYTSCKNTIAGIRNIYIAGWDDYGLVTGTASSQEITDLGTLTTVYQYGVRNDGNSWVETSETDRNNGTSVFNQELTAIINKVNAEKAFQLKMLVYSISLVFVELSNGKVQVLGFEDGCEANVTATVEGLKTGANNYQVVFTAQESQNAYFLTNAAITALKALVSSSNIED